ncbi:MAG: single-stranded DNA-binding protein [Methylococcales bacterium]|nr:single-stranded DNA-binding protein [Methylococcales bacterium]
MNKLIITGRLTRDAQVRYLPSGLALLSFSVANHTGYGENEKTHFFNCSLVGKKAEGKLCDFMKKGKEVIVEGEVSLNTYQKNDGSIGTSLNVFANNVELIGGNPQVESESESESESSYGQPSQNNQPQKSEYIPSVKDNNTSYDAPYDDDIPF